MSILRHSDSLKLGRMIQPRDRTDVFKTPRAGILWAADNDGFRGFKEEPYVAMLDAILRIPGCLFVTAPDVVEEAEPTLKMFAEWEPELHRRRLPVALVGQDGMTVADVPWDRLDALFIGGSTKWKLGSEAAQLARHAGSLGKWVHMGRVNSFRRMRYAEAIGCDSIDGTKYAKHREVHLDRALQWLDNSVPQGILTESVLIDEEGGRGEG